MEVTRDGVPVVVAPEGAYVLEAERFHARGPGLPHGARVAVCEGRVAVTSRDELHVYTPPGLGDAARVALGGAGAPGPSVATAVDASAAEGRVHVVVGLACGEALYASMATEGDGNLGPWKRYTCSPAAGAAWADRRGRQGGSRTGVTCVGIRPRSRGRVFASGHADGGLRLFDRSRDGGEGSKGAVVAMPPSEDEVASTPAVDSSGGETSAPPLAPERWGEFRVERAAAGWTGNPCVRVFMAPDSSDEKGAAQGRGVTCLAWSAGGASLACGCQDGAVRVLLVGPGGGGVASGTPLNPVTLVCVLRPQFGYPMCCAFSPDGQYLATGGQDDTVTLWRVGDDAAGGVPEPVALAEGHASWVTHIAWDPWAVAAGRNGRADGGAARPAAVDEDLVEDGEESRAETAVYRLASVGEDAKLLLWEFKSATLPCATGALWAAGKGKAAPPVREPTPLGKGSAMLVMGGPRAALPALAPVAGTPVPGEPLCDLAVCSDGLLTADFGGRVKLWRRPTS